MDINKLEMGIFDYSSIQQQFDSLIGKRISIKNSTIHDILTFAESMCSVFISEQTKKEFLYLIDKTIYLKLFEEDFINTLVHFGSYNVLQEEYPECKFYPYSFTVEVIYNDELFGSIHLSVT